MKNNQKNLRKQIVHGCNNQEPNDVYEDPFTKEHGRIEMRKYEVFDSEPMLKKWKKEWPYLRSIVRVTRYREVIGDKPTTTISYYVSNTDGLSAEEMGTYIRDHWGIENKLHNVKDATFREDFTTKRVNPYVFSSIIDIALNIIKSKGATNIRKTLFVNAMDLDASIQYLFNTSTP